MNKNIKWILIGMAASFAVLLIAALLFGAFGLHGRMPYAMGGFGRHPMMDGFDGRGMHDGFRAFGGRPMMGGFGLPGVLWLLGGLAVPLLIFGLAVYGVIALLRRSRQPQVQVASSSAAAPAEATALCAHCGSPTQPGWNHCPACGEKI